MEEKLDRILNELLELRTTVMHLDAHVRANLIRLYVPVDAEPLVELERELSAKKQVLAESVGL